MKDQCTLALNEFSHSRICLPFIQPKFKIQKYGFNSVRYQESRLWNHLDNEHINSNKLNEFVPNCDMCILN